MSKKFAKRPGVKDVVLFGSAAKGGISPGDIDVAIIGDDSVDRSDATGEFARMASKAGINAHASTLFLRDVFSEPLWASVIREGVSLLTGEPLAKSLGYAAKTLFQYDAGKLSKSRRVSFQYALAGRDGKSGLVADAKCEKFSGNAIMAPVGSESNIVSFFELWKVPYKMKRVLSE